MKKRTFIRSFLAGCVGGTLLVDKSLSLERNNYDEELLRKILLSDRISELSLFDFLTEDEIRDSQTYNPVLDLSSSFQLFAKAIGMGVVKKFIIPPGLYLCSTDIEVKSEKIIDLVIIAHGATIVITSPLPQSRRHYFRISNVAQAGRSIVVDGLTMRHNRPVGRCANTDMMLFAGFSYYKLLNLSVLSSDNMGITVGRGDPPGFTPESIFMLNPRVGGLYESTPHECGSIGDSGIWIVNAPSSCHIISPKVTSTGDDGILVGETVSTTAGNVFIENADVSDCGGNGICVSVPNGRITGRIRRTNQSGVALQFLQGTGANNFRVDVVIEDAGQLAAGDIGARMIPKHHPYGIWIYQGGGNIDLDGTVIRRSYASGINLQTRPDGILSGVTGRVTMDGICQDRSGNSSGGSDHACLRRSGTGFGVVKNVSLSLVVIRSNCPLVHWMVTGLIDDESIDVRIDAMDIVVNNSYYKHRSLIFIGRTKTSNATVRGMRIRLDTVRVNYEKLLTTLYSVGRDDLLVTGQ